MRKVGTFQPLMLHFGGNEGCLGVSQNRRGLSSPRRYVGILCDFRGALIWNSIGVVVRNTPQDGACASVEITGVLLLLTA